MEKAGITSDLKYSDNPERLDCPAYYLNHDSPAQRVQDLKAVVNRVKDQHSYARIIALGGSEGAAVAAAYAAETGVPSAVVFMSGGGRWFINDVFHNIRATVPPEVLQAELQGFEGFAEHVVTGEPFSLEVSGHGYKWWHSTLTMDL